MPQLLPLQQDFLRALKEPLFGDNRRLALLEGGAPEASASFEGTASTLIRSTASVGSTERLALYQRQYWYRLLDSLDEDFPQVKRLLGASVFQQSLEQYLLAHPPTNWNLRHLGKAYGAFLREWPPLTPHLRLWAGALGDYEYAFMEAFEAGREPEPRDEQLASGTFRLQPHLRLVPSPVPLSVWLEQTTEALPVAAARQELHVVWRSRDSRLLSRREPRCLHPLLRALQEGGTLEQLLARASSLPSSRTLRAAFRRWRLLGWLALSPTSTLRPSSS